jgi:hypothetical protein
MAVVVNVKKSVITSKLTCFVVSELGGLLLVSGALRQKAHLGDDPVRYSLPYGLSEQLLQVRVKHKGLQS